MEYQNYRNGNSELQKSDNKSFDGTELISDRNIKIRILERKDSSINITWEKPAFIAPDTTYLLHMNFVETTCMISVFWKKLR